ncbi:hypothetical protein GCM10009662_43900 [Catellatospora coxensis]|uniref:Uncharacterized protein n=1 Tax=Catellatospora coxensis TaxID=310354 RepID=A0A8J3KZ27_9ACTN|nr:hypothetical protein Cco03nite_23760 [Catellatospora coxensis]
MHELSAQLFDCSRIGKNSFNLTLIKSSLDLDRNIDAFGDQQRLVWVGPKWLVLVTDNDVDFVRLLVERVDDLGIRHDVLGSEVLPKESRDDGFISAPFYVRVGSRRTKMLEVNVEFLGFSYPVALDRIHLT